MKHSFFLLSLLPFIFSCGHAPTSPNKSQLTVERLYESPSLAGSNLRSLKLSPDGTRATYLKSKVKDQFVFDLWEFNIKTKTHQLLVNSEVLSDKNYQLSEAEKAYRERLRLAGNKGILSYKWSSQGNSLLFPINGDIYIYNINNQKVRRLTKTKAAETDPRFSPKGNFVSYVRKQNLYVYDLKKNREFAITTKGRGAIKYAMAEFIAQEEMKRQTGYWWSPNEKWIALTKVDERSVELVKRYEIYADNVKMIEQRYPYAGKTNAVVQLAIARVHSQPKLHWLPFKEHYLNRVNWRPDSKVLTYQSQPRSQKKLFLKSYSLTSKKQHTLIEESSSTWINLHFDLTFLKDTRQLIWSSERDGFRHLYLYDWTGRLIRQLTKGQWAIDKIVGYNKKTKSLFFTAAAPKPFQKNLFRFDLTHNTTTPMTSGPGWNEISFSKNGELYLRSHSQPLTPPSFHLHKSDGSLISSLVKNEVLPAHPLYPYKQNLPNVSLQSFKSKNGTPLYYTLFTPKNFSPSRKYPLLVLPYGGPMSQVSAQKWGRKDLWYSLLASKGYVVINLDNRGSPRRGKKFEDHLHRKMGTVEVEDQAEGVQHLIKKGFIDPKRIGIMGWSYGGYLSLMSFFKHPELYAVGVAVAPVTDWSLYDTHYTERYMETPKQNPQGYKESNVLNHIKKTKNQLLVIHGMADDNVLFNNSTQLFSKLQNTAQPFSMMLYPGKKHGIAGKNTRIHVFNTITKFFDKNLKP